MNRHIEWVIVTTVIIGASWSMGRYGPQYHSVIMGFGAIAVSWYKFGRIK